MGSVPSAEYLKAVTRFRAVVESCIAVSHRCAGIRSPTGSHYYASALFTVLCARSVSMLKLVPKSADRSILVEPWDYGTVSILTRGLLEVRLAFHYLAIAPVSDTEWNCRWNLMCLHDCTSRIRLFHEDLSLGDDDENVVGFKEQAEELKQRLEENAFFKALPEKRQRHLFRGVDAYLSPLEAVAAQAGIEVENFRLLYRLFSSQAHSLPVAFFRMNEGDRGRGEHTAVEEGYIRVCLEFASELLEHSRTEMEGKFHGVAV